MIIFVDLFLFDPFRKMMADIPDTNNVSGYGNHSSSFNRFRHHHQHNQGNLLILEPNTPIDGALNELMKYCDSNSVDFGMFLGNKTT